MTKLMGAHAARTSHLAAQQQAFNCHVARVYPVPGVKAAQVQPTVEPTGITVMARLRDRLAGSLVVLVIFGAPVLAAQLLVQQFTRL